MAIKLIYKDEIPGVAEGATVSVAVETENFSTPSVLPFGVNTGGIATLEPNGWGLTYDYKVKDGQTFGFWSAEISDENGNFENPPVLILTLDAKHILSGITLGFSPETNEYCKEVSVVLYSEENVVYADNLSINDTYYDIEFKGGITLDKIKVSVNKTNFPYRRAKVELLKAGITRAIPSTNIEAVNLINEIDLISEQIPRNVIDATFYTPKQTNIVFQNAQNIEFYQENKIVGNYYIDKGQQDGHTVYSVSASDRMGLLEAYQYYPSYREGDGIWFDYVPATEIMKNILGDMFGFELSPELQEIKLRGYCQEGTMSEAICQVAFALGAFIDVSSDLIKLSKVKTTVESEIPITETFRNGTLENIDMVTNVSVGGCEIRNVHPEDSYHPNYVQTPNGAYVYIGFSAVASNPNKAENSLTNSLRYTSFLISSSEQAQNVADYIMSIKQRQRKYTFSHIDRGQRVGEYVKCYLPWGEPTSGIIVKKASKYSGIAVSETTVLLDN